MVRRQLQKIVRDGSTYKTIVTTTDKSGKSETNTTDGIQAVTLGNDATIVINYIAQATGVVTGVTSDGTKLTDVKTVQTDVNGTVADADSTLTFDSLPAVSGYLPVQKSFDLAEATTLTGLNQAVNVIYMVDATKAGDNHDVNVAKDSAVVKAAATLQTALASATTQDAVQKAVAAYDQAVQQAVADQTTAKTVAGNLASYPDNLTSTALTTAKQAVADAVAGLTDGSKSTDDLNKALTDYATAVQKAVTDDAAKLATTTEASDATVKADKATLDSKVADLTSALKSGDQTKINQATQAVTDAKNALDKAVQAAANTNANGVADLKDANLTVLQTALQDATKAGTIADIAAKEASLVDGVKNTANTLLDQVTADQAAVTSANDDATKTAASDLDGAKVELQNVLAAVPAASVAAIVTAVKALDDKKRAYESAVKNAVTLNDDTKAVTGLAASDAAVNTAVNALKKALTDGTLTDLATAESGLKSAINAAATAAGNTADAEQDVVAKMSVPKDADVTAAGTILDLKQAELATLVKSGTATSDEIATAVTAVNNAKNDYDAKVIAAVKKNDVTDAVSALATPGSAIETAVSGLNDALTSGDMTKIASAETALQNAVSDAAKQANVDADNAQKIVANMPSANDADVIAKSGALDQAQTELKNLLAADSAATTDAIATAVAKVKSAQKDYTDAVVAAVKQNDLTPDVNALAKSDTTVATAVSNLNDAMASGDMTKIADAETKLNTAVKNAATTANGDADSEQTQIADMTASKDATVKVKNSALDSAQADLKTVLADKTATTDDIAKAVNAVNTAKSALDNVCR